MLSQVPSMALVSDGYTTIDRIELANLSTHRCIDDTGPIFARSDPILLAELLGMMSQSNKHNYFSSFLFA